MPLQDTDLAAVVDRPAGLVESLVATRAAMKRFRLAMSLAGAILLAIAIASVVAVADVSWVLPTWSRALGLFSVVVAAMIIPARTLLSPARRMGRDEVAVDVESAFPELGQRVRTTLEYSEPTSNTAPASPSLVRALLADTDRQVDGLDFPAIVPWHALIRRGLGLAAAISAVLVALAYDSNLRIAARRLFLRPVHYTTLSVDPGDRTLKEGSEFLLRATLAGRPVSSARWLHRPAGGQGAWTPISLAPTTRPGEALRPLIGTLESILKDCRADFEYRVVAGEVEGAIFRVTVTHPLTLKSFEAEVQPPAYTRLKPFVAREGNFRVPEGSKVSVRMALDRSPISARIAWIPEGSETPAERPLVIDGNKLMADLPPLAKDLRYEVIASAADGMTLGPVRYLIKVRPDEKPALRFVKPAESHAATPTTEVALKVEAADDYGVARVGMTFQVGDEAEETIYLDDPKDQPPSLEALATLYLETHKLTYADSVGYRAFVEDNRSPGPQRVSTELRFIDILPYKQAFQFVEGGGSCNGTSVTLEELIARQRLALNRAFAHAEDRPAEEKVANRLSKDEAELAIATGEFAMRLASEFGPISPLTAAARSMEAATVSLAAREFGTAIPQEQAALTALTRARQNLRKLMGNAASAGQCRKVDRQQQQKLRKPPAADKSKEAELAKLEQDLRKLADNQKRFAEELDPRGGGGADLDREDKPKPSRDSGPDSSPAERQRAASREARRLEELARGDKALTELAVARMNQARGNVDEAEKSIGADRTRDAAESARTAAGQLDRLAEQVAGLKAGELAGKIARARELAQSTAMAERSLAVRGASGEKTVVLAEQGGLAERAKSLADLLERIKADAVEDDRAVARAIEKATDANSPAEIEHAMREASASLASGEGEKSARAMGEASKRLEGLADDLETARRDYMQPKLREMLAAEKRAAEVQKALDSAGNEAKKAEAEKAIADLARAVESLKPGEGPIRQAADALAQLSLGGGLGGWTAPGKVGPNAGLYTPPVSYTNAVREISKALQARIQEMILSDALVDRDGAVPPGYKEKVEDYFRVLSEDLR